MPLSQLPTLLSAWLTDITAALDRRSAPRLLLLFIGALFAKGRRTVTSWFRPAGINTDFRRGYAALWSAGRRVEALSYRLLCVVLKPLMRRAGQGPLRFAIDDTPTARYGPACRELASITTPRPVQRARSSSMATSWQYGVKVVKRVKTFLATWRPAGGVIRVVLVREETGWLAYFCTDPMVSAAEVLEVMADRTAIEQTFKDVKEVWGAGQQQVRNVYANLGAMALNLIWYSLVEAWAWLRREEELVVRPVWDEEERRPSHADKRRALQREILKREIRAAVGERPQSQEFQDFATRLLDLAA
jgi:hypothetical protein